MGVATKSERQIAQDEPRVLPQALMGGTTAMIDAGKTYLPQHSKEHNDDYKSRLESTTLYNGFADTVKKQSSKPFIKDIVINDDVPAQIADLMDNIDGQGRNITMFGYDCIKEGMIDGISFIYVDFPPLAVNDGGFATGADQQSQGARPSAIMIEASQILGFKTENILGTQELTEIRIIETALEQDPEDEYIEVSIQQVRLLRRGSYELWRIDNNKSFGSNLNNWVLFEEGTTSIPYIPIIPVYTNRTGFMEGYPPLRPLAELNKEHWNSSSEQRNALTFARFAMLVVIGGQKENPIGEVSANSVLYLDNERGDIKNVSTAGDGINQGFIDIDKIEERMRHTGMTIRVQTDSGQTATEANINSEESNASLLAVATGLENAFDTMLQIFADYMGLPSGGTVTVYKGFGSTKATATLQELQSLHDVSGVISTETLLSEAVKAGKLSEDFDIKGEAQKVNDCGMNNII